MLKIDSKKHINDIKDELYEILNSLENVYWEMRKECKDEILEEVDDHIKKKNEMADYYEQLVNSGQERIYWIKKKLPWYLTLFTKIYSYEISLRDTSIFIGVSFGEHTRSDCYIKLTPNDIEINE